MNPIQHSACNSAMKAPPDMKDCIDLPVLRISDEATLRTLELQSFWMPDAAELAHLNAGHPVLLTIIGGMHPPVRVQVCAVKE